MKLFLLRVLVTGQSNQNANQKHPSSFRCALLRGDVLRHGQRGCPVLVVGAFVRADLRRGSVGLDVHRAVRRNPDPGDGAARAVD